MFLVVRLLAATLVDRVRHLAHVNMCSVIFTLMCLASVLFLQQFELEEPFNLLPEALITVTVLHSVNSLLGVLAIMDLNVILGLVPYLCPTAMQDPRFALGVIAVVCCMWIFGLYIHDIAELCTAEVHLTMMIRRMLTVVTLLTIPSMDFPKPFEARLCPGSSMGESNCLIVRTSMLILLYNTTKTLVLCAHLRRYVQPITALIMCLIVFFEPVNIIIPVSVCILIVLNARCHIPSSLRKEECFMAEDDTEIDEDLKTECADCEVVLPARVGAYLPVSKKNSSVFPFATMKDADYVPSVEELELLQDNDNSVMSTYKLRPRRASPTQR